MIRVLNIFSDLEHSKTFELVADHVDRARIDFRALFLNPSASDEAPLVRHFTSLGIPTTCWTFRGRRDYLSTLLRLRRTLIAEHYDVVHTHLMWAHYVGIPAAWLAGVRRRIMTRWHATTHHREHPGGLKYDRTVNRLATRIIAPSAATARILTEWEHVPAAKVTQLTPPIATERFRHPDPESVETLRRRYNADGRHPVIGVVARWVEWKGVQYVIPAFERLLAEYPDALLLLFNAVGDYSDDLRALLSRIPERNYRVVAFEPMSEALYGIFDVFVHVPVDEFVETWGIVYVEALAAGVPSIFTICGAVTGKVEHLKHCYVVPYRNADAILEGVRTLLSNPALARAMAETGSTLFDEECRPGVHVSRLAELYA